MKELSKKSLTLKTLSKSNVWDVQENDILRIWSAAERETDFKENVRHYIEIIRNAFEVEEIKVDKPEVIKKYEARGFKIGTMYLNDSGKVKCAIKKRAIMRVTDLTYENINHITAAKLIEVLERNFGGGWDSLSQSIQDIICSGFDISTTTLPHDRLHNKGGMYEKKVADGFEVLEIPKGTWTEAIFVKAKPVVEKQHISYEPEDLDDEDMIDEEELPEIEDTYDETDDDDDFDEEMLTEESYRTTIEEDPDDLNLDAAELSDEDDY